MILFRCLLSHRCQFLNNPAQLGRGQGSVCDETLQGQGALGVWYGLYSNFCPSLGTHAYIGTWSLKSYLFWHTSSVYVPIYQCQSAYFVTVWEKLTITINLSIPSSNTHGWYKSTYFSKLGKHNSGGDSSQHTFGWSNSVIPMGDTSQHTFQNQENTKVVVIQVNIYLHEAIPWYPWVIQVNILSKSRKHKSGGDSS